MDSKIIKYILIILLFSFKVYAIEFEGKFIQGHFILGKTETGSKIIIDKKEIKVSKDGYFVFGIDRDRKNDVVIKILKNKELKTIIKKVYKKKYDIQRIDGLPQKQVTPPKEVYDRIRKDNQIIGKARSIDSELIFFKNKFQYNK